MYMMRLSVLLFFALLISGEFFNQVFSAEISSAQAAAKSIDGKGAIVLVKNYQVVRIKGQVPRDSMPGKWQSSKINTTSGSDYLTETERQIIIEINMMRSDPAHYARMFLIPLRSYYHKKLLRFPGEIAISTNEGIRALDECIKDFQVAKPLSPLSPAKGLTLAARDHAKDQQKTGATGHIGSDRSTMESRLNRYGKWGISVGENIDYGNGEAKRIVTSLLIDDGVPSRGHRRNLLSDSFKFVGVAVGTHRVYKHICVMDFAGSYL